MKHKDQTPLAQLSNARRWLEVFEDDLDPAPQDLRIRRSINLLIAFTKVYIIDLMHTNGLAKPYDSDFDRYHDLKVAVRSINEVLDHLTDLHAGRQPSEVTALVAWVFAASYDLCNTIRLLEGQHSEYPALLAEVDNFYTEHCSPGAS